MFDASDKVRAITSHQAHADTALRGEAKKRCTKRDLFSGFCFKASFCLLLPDSPSSSGTQRDSQKAAPGLHGVMSSQLQQQVKLEQIKNIPL